MQNVFRVLLASICPCIVVALIETKYAVHNPQGGENFSACGEFLQDSNACAGRVTNTTCEPLTADWCVTKDMTDGATYMTKKSVTERFKETLLVNTLVRLLPVMVTEGSEIHVVFKLSTSWYRYAVDLRDVYNNIILYISMRSPADVIFSTHSNGTWIPGGGIYGTFNIASETQHTLRIVCHTNHFLIYVDGVLQWTYPHQLPPTSARRLLSYFPSVPGDIYQITYKSPP